MGQKEFDPGFLKTSAVLLINDRNELPLVLRDDGPAFCVFGGIAEGDEDHLACVKRELGEETNIRPEEWPEPEFLYALEGTYNNKIIEQCHVFKLDIGAYPLKLGNEGIKIDFFTPENIPVNMKSWQGQLLQEAFKGPRPETIEHPVPFVLTSQFQEYGTRHRSSFTALDEWRSNAVVMDRKARGTLKYDPDAAGAIVASLLAHRQAKP